MATIRLKVYFGKVQERQRGVGAGLKPKGDAV